MSLINEALKKAQRLRQDGDAEPSAPATTASAPIARRAKPHSANTVVLFGSAALVLVVVSVVFTVYFVNRPLNHAPVVDATRAPSASTPAPIVAESSARPIVAPTIITPATSSTVSNPSSASDSPQGSAPSSADVANIAPNTPSVVLPAPTTSPASSSEATTATSRPAAPAVPSPVIAAAAVQTAPAEVAPVPTLAPDAPDERITAFVESVRVTGIRSSGAESRVLMNERVYRVNDIVERTLNVRLIKAAADSLTFSDARGITYVKRF